MVYKRLMKWQRELLPNGMELICCGGGEGNFAILVRNWTRGSKGVEALCDTVRTPNVRKIIVDNTFTNICRIKKGIIDIKNSHNGQTAFIIGSSPSIVNQISLFNELKQEGKSTTIVINSALELVQSNTEYYMVVDYIAKREWYESIPKEIKDKIKLIASIQVPTNILNHFPNYYNFFGYAGYGINLRYNYLGCLDHGLTATFSAIHFAYFLGCKRIVFIGQDFAYTNNMNHWNEPLTMEWINKYKCYPVQDIYGNAVLSDDRLIRNKDCIKGACIFLEEAGIECINATEGGILDINCKSLEQVLKEI